MLSIWTMPGPSFGCFVMTKSVRQHKIVKGGKLQKSESSLICVIIVGSGQVLWTCTGRNKTLPPSTSLPVMGEIVLSTWHHWADIFIVWRKEPDGWKGSMMNSMATCLTLPVTHHMMKTSNHIILDWSPPRSTRTAPSAVHQVGGVKCATGASSKIRGRDNITIGTWNTRTLRAAGWSF